MHRTIASLLATASIMFLSGCATNDDALQPAMKDMIRLLENDRKEDFIRRYSWQYYQYRSARGESNEAIDALLIDVDERLLADLHVSCNMDPSHEETIFGERVVTFSFDANTSNWRDLVFRYSDDMKNWKLMVPPYHVIP
jgi:hypothetical protein